jgi:hypothetical protein
MPGFRFCLHSDLVGPAPLTASVRRHESGPFILAARIGDCAGVVRMLGVLWRHNGCDSCLPEAFLADGGGRFLFSHCGRNSRFSGYCERCPLGRLAVVAFVAHTAHNPRTTRRSTQQPPAVCVVDVPRGSAVRFAADAFLRRLWVHSA